MRIYQVTKFFHLDLSKVLAIRQFMDKIENPKPKKGGTVYRYWIDVMTEYGRHITIDCKDESDMEIQYRLLLTAWQSYAGDEILYEPDTIYLDNYR